MPKLYKRTWTPNELEAHIPSFCSYSQSRMMVREYARAVSQWCGADEVMVLKVTARMIEKGTVTMENGYIQVKHLTPSSEEDWRMEKEAIPTGWEHFRKLLTYYRQCIHYESGASFSGWEDQYLKRFSFLSREGDWFPKPVSPELWRLTLNEGTPEYFEKILENGDTLCLGYPVYSQVVSVPGNGESSETLVTKPVFYWRLKAKVRTSALGRTVQLSLANPEQPPEVNLDWFKYFCRTVEKKRAFLSRCGLFDNQIQAGVGDDENVEEFSSIILPNWSVEEFCRVVTELFSGQVRELLYPQALSATTPSKASPNGFYNKAMLFCNTPSPYSKRLEEELVTISSLPDEALDKTALRAFFKKEDPTATPRILLTNAFDVLDFTDDQRGAVASMLQVPLTVMQGPPGTGKSQVIAGVALNASLHGQSVLISAHTHKAVDAVEERINKLEKTFGAFPFIHCQNSEQNSLISSLTRFLRENHRSAQEAKLRDLDEHRTVSSQFDSRKEAENQLSELYENVLSSARAQLELDQLLKEHPQLAKFTHSFTLASVQEEKEELQKWLEIGGDSFFYSLFHPYASAKRRNWIRTLSEIFGESHLVKSGVNQRQKIEHLIHQSGVLERYCRLREKVLELKLHRAKLDKDAPRLLSLIAQLSEELKNRLPDFMRMHIKEQKAELLNQSSALTALIDSIRQFILRDEGQHSYVLGPQNKARFENVFKALPAWGVTTLSVGRHLPITPGLFDLVMLDEASQMNIAQAIPLLCRAKRAAIIGDPQQLSVISGLSDAQDIALRRSLGLLQEEDAHFCYYRKTLYDLAESTPNAVRIRLNETFRNCAPIASYCSKYFYGNALSVATDESRLKIPAEYSGGIGWVDVQGPISQGTGGRSCMSEDECLAVVRQVKSILLNAQFQGTVGVVTPFNPQAVQIQELVEQEIPRDVLDRAMFVSATSHAFQGGERDVMILSLCGGSDMPPGCLRFLRSDPSIFNVAVSRARSLLLVIGNKEWARNCGIEFIKGLTLDWNHASDIQRTEWYPYESPWEKTLAEALEARQLGVIAQHKVGKRRLDLALMDDVAKLDIEVDGAAYHKDEEGVRLQSDYWREVELQQFGWATLRFCVYELQNDLEGCVDRVVKKWAALHERRGRA